MNDLLKEMRRYVELLGHDPAYNGACDLIERAITELEKHEAMMEATDHERS